MLEAGSRRDGTSPVQWQEVRETPGTSTGAGTSIRDHDQPAGKGCEMAQAPMCQQESI